MISPEDDVSQTLSRLHTGDSAAAAQLMDLVYEPLRKLAHAYFRGQGNQHTLQPTALVHEVFLRMVGKREDAWNDRAHFFAVCATAMRGILLDHSRKQRALKRGGDLRRVTLSALPSDSSASEVDVMNLDEVLLKLEKLNERQARIVEYRFFSGMTLEEIATALGVSRRTVDNDWAMARAWISLRLSERG